MTAALRSRTESAPAHAMMLPVVAMTFALLSGCATGDGRAPAIAHTRIDVDGETSMLAARHASTPVRQAWSWNRRCRALGGLSWGIL